MADLSKYDTNLETSLIGSARSEADKASQAPGLSSTDDLTAVDGNDPVELDDLGALSYLTEMDLSAVDSGGKATETPLHDLWDRTSTPQREMKTPDTSSMDQTPTKMDEMNESGCEDSEPKPLKYHLRPQTRELKSSFTRTWIDRDESGNYGEKDSGDEARKAQRRRSRVKFRLRADNDSTTELFDGSGPADERPMTVIPKLEVRLSFQSEAGRRKFKHLIYNLRTRTKLQHDEVKYNGYRLRTRGSSLSTRYYSEVNLDKSKFGPALPDDLTGYPAVRGCWECFALGLRCPLLDDERAWPCVTCIDDDHDCDLITPPEFKRACERCKRRKTSCSYLYTEQHGEACQQCMDDGFRCIAGPAKDTIPTRIRYDRDWEKDPLQAQKPFKIRKIPNLFDTARVRKPDESTTKPTGDPTEQDDEGVADMESVHNDPIYQRRVSAHQSAAHGHKRKLDNGERTERRIAKAQRWNDTQGTTRTIDTKFCHPIIFNHDSTGAGTPCHFCSDPSYGIFGLEEKEVEVIEWTDGRRLEEVSGGHKGEGVENTRLCLKCTTERIPIIVCPAHELRPIQGIENSTLDLNDAFAELLSGSGKLKGKWCAVCANLARYECCTPADEGDGCGLLVCEECMVELSGIYDGDLQKMLPRVRKQPSQERVLGLRADYEFLKEDGLLMRYVLWSSEPQ